jgi:uncharacterized repeat protein (TIGR01451 family)
MDGPRLLCSVVFVLAGGLIASCWGQDQPIATSGPGGPVGPALPLDPAAPRPLSLPDDGLPLLAVSNQAAPAVKGGGITPAVFRPEADTSGAPRPFLPGATSAGPVAAPPSPPAGQPGAVPKGPLAAPQAGQGATLTVETHGPEQVGLGQPLTQEIIVRNNSPVPLVQVRLEEPLPPGVRLVRAEPPPVDDRAPVADRVVWNLGTLEARGERRVLVQVNPGTLRELMLSPSVTFKAIGLHTRIQHPEFGLTLTGPAHARRGEQVAFRLEVFNQGGAPARQVQVKVDLPAGLEHPSGRQVGAEVGDVNPGDVRTLPLETTAKQSGRLTAVAVAEADGGLRVEARAEVVVVEPVLEVRLDGPRELPPGREADFRMEVSNSGPGSATGVRLRQFIPAGLEVLQVSSGGQFDPARRELIWTLAALPAGQRQTVLFKVRPRSAGEWALYTWAVAENRAEVRTNQAVRVAAAPSLVLEVTGHDDAIEVGRETVYEVRVSNLGSAPGVNLRLAAWLPEELAALQPQGPAAGKVERQQVSFAPLPQLSPQGDAVYRIRVRGQHPGSGRLRLELTADGVPRPVQEEISTQVRGPAPPTPQEDASKGAGK